MGSLPSSSTTSSQMEPKCRFWFRMLSTQWCQWPLLDNTRQYEEKQLMKYINPASWANAEGSYDITKDSTNSVGLEYQMQEDSYLEITDKKHINFILGQLPKKWHWPITRSKPLTWYREKQVETGTETTWWQKALTFYPDEHRQDATDQTLGRSSAQRNFVPGSHWECLGVVGPESQASQITKSSGPM